MCTPLAKNADRRGLENLTALFPRALIYEVEGDLYVKVPLSYVRKILYFLKHHTLASFEQLIDLSFVDYPERRFRFEVFYNLLSLSSNRRIVVTASLAENAYLESASEIYPSAA
jgi:NADH-quinone oxidoreductase subunit C